MRLEQTSPPWPANTFPGQAGEGTDEYRKRVDSEILYAIERASGASDTTAPVILSAQIIEACLNTIVSSAVVTPEGATLEFADQLGWRLREKMRVVRAKSSINVLDFLRIAPRQGQRCDPG
jgi:hypothetical protein